MVNRKVVVYSHLSERDSPDQERGSILLLLLLQQGLRALSKKKPTPGEFNPEPNPLL